MPTVPPVRESDLDAWLNNFKTLIAANPTNYGLTAADATSITNAFNSWHTAWVAAVSDGTRSKLTIETKNEQKASVLFVVRGYMAQILANRGVSNTLKMGLGLHVRDTTPTPVPPPSTRPALKVVKTGSGFQTVTAADEATPLKRARPAGSVGLLIYRAVAEDAVGDPANAQFLTFVGKPAAQSNFTAADRGKMATYFARWTNARGEVGPWSDGVSAPIAA
ncbi:MAG TPA: hypothetical protein VHC70_02180 [Phycisphaerales bacterium]|jgi:hypothetical protein|nr:hypothetical protein [Phycisphaerales bacterium]